MIVRRLHKEDLIDAARIRSISFHGKLNEEEAAKGIEQTSEDKLYEHWGCFADDGDIAFWALEAAARTSAAGLFQGGSGNKLMPLSTSTRAEAAAVLSRVTDLL